MRVIWSEPARDDLRRINEWLTSKTSPAFAVRTLLAIRTRGDFLVDFPHGARPLKVGTRVLRVLETRYLILYRIEGGQVEVTRVHHEREDWLVEP